MLTVLVALVLALSGALELVRVLALTALCVLCVCHDVSVMCVLVTKESQRDHARC